MKLDLKDKMHIEDKMHKKDKIHRIDTKAYERWNEHKR